MVWLALVLLILRNSHMKEGNRILSELLEFKRGCGDAGGQEVQVSLSHCEGSTWPS